MRYLLGLLALLAAPSPLSASADAPIRQYPVCDQNGLPEIARWIKELDRDDMRLVVVPEDRVQALHQQLLYDQPDAVAVLDGLDFVIGYEIHERLTGEVGTTDFFVYKLFVRGCPIGDGWVLTEWLFSNTPAYRPEPGRDI